MKEKTVIIGAGLAGLSAADFLAKRGEDPLLLESENYLGGRTHCVSVNNQKVSLGAGFLTKSYSKAFELCKEKKININDELSLNVEKLINLYKKEKNYLFIRLSIFLINQFYVTKIIKTDNTNLFQERNETIKKVLNISSFNLNNKNILYDLKNIV